MKSVKKTISMSMVLALCISFLAMPMTASSETIYPFSNTIFGSYSVNLPSTMTAEFHVLTRKTVPSVFISATMQVLKNERWEDYSTDVSPEFSGSSKTSWTTTAKYGSACEKGYKYRLVVTYSSSGTSVDYTSNERTYN